MNLDRKVIPLALGLLLLTALAAWAFFRQKQSGPPVAPAPPLATHAPTPPPPPPRGPLRHPPREFVPRWEDLEAYQETISASALQQAIEEVYALGNTWKEVISIEPERAVIQTAGAPFVLRLLPEDAAPPPVPRYWREVPLHQMRIALDPGHIGGPWAAMENRQWGPTPDTQVREGEIALLTALRLKPLLEKMGATVTLVRSKNAPVTKQRPEDFLRLYREYNPGWPDALLRPEAENRFYRRAEIVARAQIVNETLKPDLVLCLHYNASGDSGNWLDPTRPVFSPENHFHLLLNGAYTEDEIRDEGERFQMMQRILQRIHQREVALATIAADVFAERTGLPAYAYVPGSGRARQVRGHPYLWARNLLANRVFTCPVLYYEPWVANNFEVYQRIIAGDYEGEREVAGKMRPSIMREYAEAVAAGLAAYFEEAKRAAAPPENHEAQ